MAGVWGLLALTGLAFATGGYVLGTKFRRDAIPVETLVSSADSSPAADPAPPPPNPTPRNNARPDPPRADAAADAEAALVAFLGAPDWQARSAFVLGPEETRPAMETHAKDHGDGPIPVSATQLLEVSPPNYIFKVCTDAIPDGFPVPVTLTKDGPKIDWASFAEFHDDQFRKLLEGPVERSGIFNLLVKPETGGEESPHYARFRVSVPMPGREATSWVRRDSVALARLKAVFDGAGGFDKDTVDRLVTETGVPLRLAVEKRRTSDGREYLEVADLVAVGWAPAKN